ncbi:MAG: hypothetical protein JSS07_11340 [Proteobacteria bacterium]|nr:hypothetical protein [Pseudomonadota bacterium]
MNPLPLFLKWILKLRKYFRSSPQIVIVSHFYQNETIQVLMKDKQGSTQVHQLQSVARKKDIINQLSAKDAFLLGYLLAEHEQANPIICTKGHTVVMTEG